MGKDFIIGIDLGGTKIAGAISDRNGKILYSSSVKTMATQGRDEVLIRIKDLIRSLIDSVNIKNDDVIGIGIGSPGPLNSKKGVIVNAVNLPGFINVPIVSIIENEFNINTYLENDANAAALGELWFGEGKGCNNFVYVTVSTGIGGGIIINGDIYSGNTSNAGEIGHTTFDPNGPICNCGNHGCLEVLASGTAIGRIANERIQGGEDSILKSYSTVTSVEVFKAAEEGDKLALDVIDYCMNYLGIGIANIANFMDPEKIIIGGGVSKAGELVFDRVKKVVNDRCFKIINENMEIVPAGLGTDAGVIGALSIVLSKLKRL